MKILAFVGIGLLGLGLVQAQTPSSNRLTQNLKIEQKLGERVPLDARLIDEEGRDVQLKELFSERPLVLLPIFYACKGSCEEETVNFLKLAVKMKETVRLGREFDVLMLGIHPKETADLARAKKAAVMKIYEQPEAAGSWHCVVGSEEEVRKITDAIGFDYEYFPEENAVNHPAGIMVLTPDGRVSQYFYGTNYPTILMKRAIELASEGKLGEEAIPYLFGCISYNPVTGQSHLVIMNVLRLMGFATLIVLCTSVVVMSIRYKTKKPEERSEA